MGVEEENKEFAEMVRQVKTNDPDPVSQLEFSKTILIFI
jgi:hypothetical protein